MPTRKHLLPLVVCLLLLFRAEAARGVRVMAPLDKAVVTESSLVVLGTAPRGADVPWSSKGPTASDEGSVKADWGDLFELFVLLEPGLNRLNVGGTLLEVFFNPGGLEVPADFSAQRVHGGDISRCEDCHNAVSTELRDGGYPGVCFGCHEVSSQNPANNAEARKDSHFLTAVANCGRCHEAHVSKDPKSRRGSNDALCGGCHAGQRPKEGTHAAYDEGGCMACHDAHYSGYPRILGEPLPGLCHRCHDQSKDIAPAKIHPPASTPGSCATCHDPHGATPKLLRSAVSEGCSGCHPGVLRAGHKDELADCARCHDPHKALGTGLVKSAALASVCEECHEGIGQGKTAHGALQRGCQACHDPHSDDNLASARKTCVRCHDLQKDRELGSIHGDLSLVPETCVRCHPAHASEEDRLVRSRLHYPLTQGKCSVCHGGGEERSVKVADPASRCRMCHSFEATMQGQGDKLHDPVASGDCTACHDPHMSPKRGLLRRGEAEVCRECHDVATAAGGKELHPPAETCTECHGAHGGRNAKFLKSAVPELCTGCHDDPRTKGGDLHPALEEGCLACHDSHAGFSPGYLKGATRNAACLGCHDDPAKGRKTVHAAVEKGCALCHEPHASRNPKFLRATGNGLCVGCHPKLSPHHRVDVARAAARPGGENFPADGDQLSCLGCHAAHASDEPKLFLRPKSDLCFTCHKGKD